MWKKLKPNVKLLFLVSIAVAVGLVASAIYNANDNVNYDRATMKLHTYTPVETDQITNYEASKLVDFMDAKDISE